MAFWNVTGGSQVTDFDANGNANGTDIDAGSIYYGGNLGSTRFIAIDPGISAVESKRGITIVSGVGWIDPVNGSSSRFNGGDQVIVKVTDEIAALSNTTLLGGDSNSAASPAINQAAVIEVALYKTAFRSGDWIPVSGTFLNSPLAVSQLGGWNISASVDNSTTLIASGTDDAANPTQAVPGELVYHYGSGADPTQDEYEARNLW